jgi:hypothetical protein
LRHFIKKQDIGNNFLQIFLRFTTTTTKFFDSDNNGLRQQLLSAHIDKMGKKECHQDQRTIYLELFAHLLNLVCIIK